MRVLSREETKAMFKPENIIGGWLMQALAGIGCTMWNIVNSYVCILCII